MAIKTEARKRKPKAYVRRPIHVCFVSALGERGGVRRGGPTTLCQLDNQDRKQTIQSMGRKVLSLWLAGMHSVQMTSTQKRGKRERGGGRRQRQTDRQTETERQRQTQGEDLMNKSHKREGERGWRGRKEILNEERPRVHQRDTRTFTENERNG